MPAQKPKSEVPIRVLLALEYAVDNDALLVGSHSVRASAGEKYMARPTREAPRRRLPDGAPTVDGSTSQSLSKRRFLRSLDAAKLAEAAGLKPRSMDHKEWDDETTPFSWYDAPSEVNAEGRAALEAGRPRLAAWRAEEAAKEDEFVAVRRRGGPGVGAWCKVVGRGAGRVYVEALDDGGVERATSAVEGHAKPYVSTDDVYPGVADKATWRRLAEATKERDASRARAKQQHLERTRPIDVEHASRLAQIDAMFEDEVADLTGTSSSPAP